MNTRKHCRNDQKHRSYADENTTVEESPGSDSGSSVAATGPARVGSLRQEEGYTLTELMIVLVVIGVLTLIAMPKFLGMATKAKMTEAKTQLRHLHMLQEAYHYEHDVYASDLLAIGFEQSTLVVDGGQARYVIAVEESDVSSYRATATAIVDFDDDGVYNIWEVDEAGSVSQRVAD